MLFNKIKELVENLDVETVSEERKVTLQPLIAYVQSQLDENEAIRLHFICTHNSRRSHFAQIWAHTMAHYFEVENVACYSGGTEATALFPMVVVSLQQTGFQIEKMTEGTNPIYSIKYAANEAPIVGFSKKMDAAFNPKSNFCAVMTCSQADEGCPFVPGAAERIPITYEDPKAFDGTAEQAEKYQERSLQIATEMKYVFAKINVK